MSDIYVVVIEDGGMGEELVLETETQRASLEKAQARAENLKSSYGKTRIARLVFIDPEKPVMGKIVQMTPETREDLRMILDENGVLWEWKPRYDEDRSTAYYWCPARMNTEPEWPKE